MDFVQQAASAYMHQGRGQGAPHPQGQGAPGPGAPHPPGQGPPHPAGPAGSPHPPGAGPPGQSRDPHQGLPPGWVAEWAAADNRYYYVNTHTGERTWNRPGAPPPPADPRVGLPPGWVAEWDAPDKRWFYVNTHTGARQWDRPHATGAVPPAQVTQVHASGPGYEQQTTRIIQQGAAPAAAPAVKNHNLAYGAAGAVAGLAGGALLMHEGHKVGTWL